MTVTSNQQPVTSFYVYDAANRLTSIQLPDSSIQAYTWDKRGNLLADGTFTYTYSAAGRMVQAQNLTATLVYTYNADSLRVAQSQSVASVQSVDLFTWDWAPGVPELLSDGESLYLVGYDTLGWQNGADWTFALPDALGSVRQATDAAGAVTAVRSVSLVGTEIGGDTVVRMIDEFPILAVAATQARGTTVVRDARELRVKETDRIATVVAELRKLGAQIEPQDDGFTVTGPTKLRGATVDSHGDHRLGMALAVAGLVAEGETVIEDAERIADSFPGFVEVMTALGGQLQAEA